MSECIMNEMQQIVRHAARPYEPGERIAALINRSARRLGLNYRRARAYWYGEVRMIPSHEADRLRALKPSLLEGYAAELASVMAECATLAGNIHDILEGHSANKS